MVSLRTKQSSANQPDANLNLWSSDSDDALSDLSSAEIDLKSDSGAENSERPDEVDAFPSSSSEEEPSDNDESDGYGEPPKNKKKKPRTARRTKPQKKIEEGKKEAAQIPDVPVDAPPLSSDEEEEGEGQDGNMSDGLDDTPKKSRLAGSRLQNTTEVKESPSSSRKRTSKEMLDGDNSDIFEGYRSSQPKKRLSYSSKSRWRKTPTSSMAESHPPSSLPVSSAAQSHSRLTSFEGKVEAKEDDNKENEQDVFKVPRDFDAELGFKQPPDLASSFSVPPSSGRLEIPDSDNDDDDSPLSSPPSSSSLNLLSKLNKKVEEDEDEKIEYLCPMCREPVEPALLIRFQAQPRQRIREQTAFCQSHQKSTADKEWREKGYPAIDWDRFDERIEGHFKDLEQLLVPDSASFYRNVLDTMLKSGQAKNFRLTLTGDALETISCGYYGTRGSGKMLQAITTRFSRKLRRLAAEDHIVKQAGVVPYSQAVLVPELAIMLIKEDMDVDDDSARQIMRESIALGEKVNFALNDTIKVDQEPEPN
ncbi:RTC4-like domain-containing protein [Aspergillus egyptiacus]|nr:RTC4-like domain-containing protein [Aspergillus egyptiacus]